VAAHVYHLEDARLLVADGVDVLAHSIRDADVDDALIAEMKKHNVAYIPTLSLDDFAFAYGGSPKWVDDPFFTAALDPGVLEMITSPEYRAKVQSNKVTAQEQAALPQAMHNLKKIYDAGILITLGTDSGATPIRIQGCRTCGSGADGPGGSDTHSGDHCCHLKRSQAAPHRRSVRNAYSGGKGQFHRFGKGSISRHSQHANHSRRLEGWQQD